MNGSGTIIYVWPDGCWCEHDELHEMSHKSDDYTTIIVPEEYDGLQTDAFVHAYLKGI